MGSSLVLLHSLLFSFCGFISLDPGKTASFFPLLGVDKAGAGMRSKAVRLVGLVISLACLQKILA